MLSPTNPLGIKAGGEGGTTAAPAVVISAVVDALRECRRARGADAGDALRDLDGDPGGEGAQGGRAASMSAPILALEKISKRFGAIVAAEAIDLELADGEALGIIGPNGAGKTTLFAIISGTLAPDSGRVLYAGRDITGLPPARRCAMGDRAVVPNSAAVRRHERF